MPDFGGGLDHVLAIRRSRLHDLLAAVRATHPPAALRLGAEVTGAGGHGTVSFQAGDVPGTVTGDDLGLEGEW